MTRPTLFTTFIGTFFAASASALAQSADLQSFGPPVPEALQVDPEEPETLVLQVDGEPAQEPESGGAAPEADSPTAESAADTSEPEAPQAELDGGLDATPSLPQGEPESYGTLQEALYGGRTWVDLRYRFEGAEVRGFLKRSWASTLRVAAGYETGSYEGFRGLIEVEGVTPILGNDYNDGTGRRGNQAPVLDPELLEINQGYLRYDAKDAPVQVRAGRQEISLGNERFVGADPWRQNHQSFDALRVKWQATDALELDYAFVFGVNRVTGPDAPLGREDLASHWLYANYGTDGYGDVAAYLFSNDFDESNALSSNTLGLRWSGSRDLSELKGEDVVGTAAVEYARQTDAYDNPLDVSADYWLVKLGAERDGLGLELAMENLGGSGDAGDAFQTPFASIQDFNGFADQFRVTPDAGLRDTWLRAGYDFEVTGWHLPANVSLSFHRFESDAGGLDYGREIDFDASVRLTDRLAVGARYADFNGDEVFRNANRAIAWVSYALIR